MNKMLQLGAIKTPHAGIGLVELMIAVSIGMVLIAGAINMFISGRSTYQTTQNLAAMQEIGRAHV